MKSCSHLVSSLAGCSKASRNCWMISLVLGVLASVIGNTSDDGQPGNQPDSLAPAAIAPCAGEADREALATSSRTVGIELALDLDLDCNHSAPPKHVVLASLAHAAQRSLFDAELIPQHTYCALAPRALLVLLLWDPALWQFRYHLAGCWSS